MKNLNAVIDESRCVNCGACTRVCQQVNPITRVSPQAWFQGWSSDSLSRAKSSSGGLAISLMQCFLQDGGYVCGCVFEKGQFVYRLTKDEKELDCFRGSKYVKSDPADIYSRIKELLKDGERVLFIGLPCHVAALKLFVGAEQENLFTVDLICHGTPSSRILQNCFKEHGIDLDKIQSVRFREKNQFRIVSFRENGKEFSFTPKSVRDRYTIGFLNGLFYTDNCYSCQYADLKRVSDITIGDSWGSELEDISKGVSLILCQTDKGEALVKKTETTMLPVDLDKAAAANHQLKAPMKKNEEREKFFSLLNRGGKVSSAVRKCYPKVCYRQSIKALLVRLHLR